MELTDDVAIFKPGSLPYGKTYAQWSAEWCKWLLSIPRKKSPVMDDTGRNCSYHQGGSVWFLVGTLGGQATRKCIIPPRKSILFPIVVKECSYAEDIDLKTDDELSSRVREDMDHVVHMEANIDGVKIYGLENYRFHSELFDFVFPHDNIYGVKAGPTWAVCEGYWLMLKPLLPGKHMIYFYALVYVPKGTMLSELSKRYNNMDGTLFRTEVTYEITID
jgi:hypothetical protein